jgi:hypothetical protein
MGFLNDLVKGVVENLEILRKNGVINAKVISDYLEMVRKNLHSWLQYSVIDAVRGLNLICIPEAKLHFSQPLNPLDFGKTNRKRNFIRVDLAVYERFNSNSLLGFAECITLDEAHECFSTKEVDYKWLTIRDKLPYAIKHLEVKPQFIIIVLTLPIYVKQIPWKVGKKEIDEILETKKYFEKLSPKWKELIDIIRKDIDAKLIIINENYTSIYPQ